jgi:carboxypeptidase Taq
MTQLEKLRGQLAEVCDLRGAASVLGWDQQTYMPPGGAAARSEQLATLGRLSHEKFISEEIGELLQATSAEVSGLAYDSDEASLLRVTRRDYEKARKVPPSLVAEIARTTSMGMEVWVKAKAQSDFAAFRPVLQRIYQLQRDLANCLGYEEHVYDALLDQYEPGMKTALLKDLFAGLKQQLVPLVQSISQNLHKVDDAVLHRTYDAQKQWNFGVEVLKRFGYDLDRGRQDKSVHPFTTSFSINDVRITTRIDENFLPSALFSTLHECGHGLYEQGVSQTLERTPLGSGASLGIHESQSRLWENLVGRSRSFWKFFFPRLQSAFSETLSDVSLENFYRAINRVQPSLIRVEADEVTYNLHVLLRFELEVEVLRGELKVADLPEAWNSKMKSYLGVVPPDDAQGVLQDVHWSNGLIGYFPTYTLGNLVSVQLFEAAKRECPIISEQLERGEFSELLTWLRKRVHQLGRKLLPTELVERATGKPLQAGLYVDYLKSKYAEIYGIQR